MDRGIRDSVKLLFSYVVSVTSFHQHVKEGVDTPSIPVWKNNEKKGEKMFRLESLRCTTLEWFFWLHAKRLCPSAHVILTGSSSEEVARVQFSVRFSPPSFSTPERTLEVGESVNLTSSEI